jgi:hypothetical protein
MKTCRLTRRFALPIFTLPFFALPAGNDISNENMPAHQEVRPPIFRPSGFRPIGLLFALPTGFDISNENMPAHQEVRPPIFRPSGFRPSGFRPPGLLFALPFFPFLNIKFARNHVENLDFLPDRLLAFGLNTPRI